MDKSDAGRGLWIKVMQEGDCMWIKGMLGEEDVGIGMLGGDCR